MKNSLLGHSRVQELHNMHKQIEDAMQFSEFYLPIPFLTVLLKVNQKKPYRVIQMNKNDFKDFQSSSKMLQSCKVSYTKVFQIKSENLKTKEETCTRSKRGVTHTNNGK